MLSSSREPRCDCLLRHFLSTFSNMHRLPVPEITPDALERLLTYNWPGNVRELKNVAERLVVGGAGSGQIGVGSLPLEIGQVRQLLREARLVTLTGPPGSGKTRLASQIAEQALDDFDGGA